ncbi:MAG: sugar ABC transporter permease [Clostridia bacterium]|nr:sugar ABC transporter permease [Clostridia bacterium]
MKKEKKENGFRTEWKKRRKTFIKNGELSLLALPTIIWVVIFSYIPMFSIILAFKDYNSMKGVFGSEWNGLDNFKFLFSSNDAAIIIRNTVLYNLAFVILATAISIIIALLLETITKKFFIKLYQTVLMLPHFVSWVVVGFVMMGLFNYENGVANNLISALGGDKAMWYSTTKPWPYIITSSYLWKQVGYQALFYYGAILAIDDSLYEAGKIDGANKIQEIFYITLPMMRTTICTLLIVSIGSMMRGDFGLFYYVPNNMGSLYQVTDVIDTYIYRMMRVVGNVGVSSAVTLFQSVVGFILVLVSNAVIKKLDSDSAMF